MWESQSELMDMLLLRKLGYNRIVAILIRYDSDYPLEENFIFKIIIML